MALSQTLVVPNPFSLNIAGPGSTASNTFTVTTSPATTISSITLGSIATSGSSGNWLCATTSGSTITYSAGAVSGCSSSTTQLTAGTYNGIIPFTTNTGLSGQMTVILNVTSGGGTAGLTFSPNPVAFSLSGSTIQSANVNIFFNGQTASVTSVSASTTTGQNWLSAVNSGFAGSVSVSANSTGLPTGSYTGSVFVVTTNGSFSFPVTLSVNGGGTTFGLAASPNPVSFTLAQGSNSQQQNVNITFNGSPVTSTSVASVVTNSGQNWLNVFNSGTTGTLTVVANPQFFSGSSDTANVTVNTSSGQLTFQVTLNSSGTGFGLAATPNPVNLSASFSGATASQNVSVTYNGSPISANVISTSTNTGQQWLQATSSGSLGGIIVNAFNTSGLSGNYSGSFTVSTQFGNLTIPVNLAVGGTGSTSGLIVSPSVLNFSIPLIGSGAPSQNVTVSFNGSPVAITGLTTSVVGQNWLLLSGNGQAGNITVGINGANLTAGTQSATVTATTPSGNVNFQVNVTVGGGSTSGLVATPNPVNLTVQFPGGSTTQNVNITYNGSPANVTGVTATTTTGQNWLIPSTSGLTGQVTVGLNTSGLQTGGTYTGTVNVNTSTGTIPFTVNLGVGTGASSGLAVTPNPLALNVPTGGAFTQQNVNVTFNGSPVLITGVTASTTTGQNWLTPSFNSSVPGTVTVSVNTSLLQTGTYSGTVTVSTASGQTTFGVTLTVGSTTGNSGLSASPNPVTFNVATTGQNPSQVITVTLNGAPAAVTNTTFVASPILAPTFVNTAVNSDGTVTLTVNNVITTPGFYQGTLTMFTATGSIAVPVQLTFGSGAGGGSSGLAANPNPVNFTVQTGASNTQAVAITFNGFPATITGVTASTTTGQNWLAPTFSAGVTGSVNVSVSAIGLNNGNYSGTVTVATTSGTFSFPVNLNVGGGTGPGSPTITTSPSSLTPVRFQIGGANPQPQTLTVALSGGGTGTFSAAANTLSGGNWLSVSPANGALGGTVTVTVNPSATGPAAGTYQGSVLISVPLATNSPISLPITLTVTAPVVVTPSVVAIQNAASSLPTSVSPGLNIVIYGSNMGPGTLAALQLGSNGALATTVSGTQVNFDGIAAPIIYTSNNQVSVMVPYEVAGRASTSMVVVYNGVSSNAISLRVVDAVPGIYTINSSGSGQGAILNQNGTVNSAANAESVGNVIQIFATGEGQTTPVGVNGAIQPSRLPLPTPNLPVTVTIGGVPVPAADITYAGEAPGAVSGVLQVNARIPAGVGTGPVAVVIRIGGIPSQGNVTVSVR